MMYAVYVAALVSLMVIGTVTVIWLSVVNVLKPVLLAVIMLVVPL